MEGSVMTTEADSRASLAPHVLYDKWTLWAHLPHDTDWTVESYKRIDTFNTIEAAVTLCETLPDKMVKNCMLFLMREGVQPTWEDPRNRSGGCFSYKVNNKTVGTAWKNLSYILVGETLSTNARLMDSITGITISPKKNFCIVKIWLSGCDFQDPSSMVEVPGLSSHGCLFKKHLPEY